MRNRADDKPVSEDEAAALFGPLAACPALVLAVSGGPDSTALLWLAARWRGGLKNRPKLIAVTIDHGLRKESAREARDVAKLARALGVTHRTLRWTGRKPKTGIQEAAREARYRLLAGAARKARSGHILTAHTLDDQAETVLFRLARGSGVSGLAGMNTRAGVPVEEGRGIWLVRPLLGVPKARLIATLDAADVSYARDPSNADPRFARPRFRALLRDLAREGLTAERLGRLAQRVARYDETLMRVVNTAQRALWPEPWPVRGPISVAATDFFHLPAEVGLRLLVRMIALTGYRGAPELSQSETLYADLVEAAGTGSRVRRTLAAALITLTDGRLTVEPAPPRRDPAAKRGSAMKRRSAAKRGAAAKRAPAAKTGTSGRKRAFTTRGSNDAE